MPSRPSRPSGTPSSAPSPKVPPARIELAHAAPYPMPRRRFLRSMLSESTPELRGRQALDEVIERALRRFLRGGTWPGIAREIAWLALRVTEADHTRLDGLTVLVEAKLAQTVDGLISHGRERLDRSNRGPSAELATRSRRCREDCSAGRLRTDHAGAEPPVRRGTRVVG